MDASTLTRDDYRSLAVAAMCSDSFPAVPGPQQSAMEEALQIKVKLRDACVKYSMPHMHS